MAHAMNALVWRFWRGAVTLVPIVLTPVVRPATGAGRGGARRRSEAPVGLAGKPDVHLYCAQHGIMWLPRM